MTGADRALLDLLRRLGQLGYRFITPTPATHLRVVGRPEKAVARDLRDIFGWSRPFERDVMPAELFDLLQEADMIAREGSLWRSEIRVASLGSRLFLHSAFPTDASDAVFFGPDSYRFARFVLAELAAEPADWLVDIGAGAGVGGIVAASEGRVAEALLTDVNPLALRFARINATHAGVTVELRPGSGLETVPDGLPLAIMNPPFIADALGRTYRDGGGLHGSKLSVDWALDAARRVKAGGRVLLYSGSAIVAGHDGLDAALREGLPPDCSLCYFEIDPDIFGEELDRTQYAEVERIAAIGAVIRRRA